MNFFFFCALFSIFPIFSMRSAFYWINCWISTRYLTFVELSPSQLLPVLSSTPTTPWQHVAVHVPRNRHFNIYQYFLWICIISFYIRRSSIKWHVNRESWRSVLTLTSSSMLKGLHRVNRIWLTAASMRLRSCSQFDEDSVLIFIELFEYCDWVMLFIACRFQSLGIGFSYS